MNKPAFIFLLFVLVLQACLPTKQEPKTYTKSNVTTILQDDEPKFHYRSSETRIFDLLHTYLEVNPNWENQTLQGKAILTLRPYFYSTKELVIDAKGMTNHSIGLIDSSGIVKKNEL